MKKLVVRLKVYRSELVIVGAAFLVLGIYIFVFFSDVPIVVAG